MIFLLCVLSCVVQAKGGKLGAGNPNNVTSGVIHANGLGTQMISSTVERLEREVAPRRKAFQRSLNNWTQYREGTLDDYGAPTKLSLDGLFQRWEIDPAHPQVLGTIYWMVRTKDTPEIWHVKTNPSVKVKALRQFLAVRNKKVGHTLKAQNQHTANLKKAAAQLLKTVFNLWGSFLHQHVVQFDVIGGGQHQVLQIVGAVCGSGVVTARNRHDWGKVMTLAYDKKPKYADLLIQRLTNEVLLGLSRPSIFYSLYRNKKRRDDGSALTTTGNQYYALKRDSYLREVPVDAELIGKFKQFDEESNF